MEQNLSIGKNESTKALAKFAKGKKHLVLVTGGASYTKCGAEAFVNEVLGASPEVKITHLIVPGANPKVNIVQSLFDSIEGDVDGFIAVGGGTPIDTAKLLNLAMESGRQIVDLVTAKECNGDLKPFMALPTTAGTGAEATRFAVCYHEGTKYSVDIEKMKPSDVCLVPEFTYSLPQYQTACTAFDAYAQSVESLWAKGATDESRYHARRALDHFECLEDAVFKPDPVSRAAMLIGAYDAGCAIDISRTTAAHAFSYFLTSEYGIPHGHAVAMVFPYILRANVKAIEKIGDDRVSVDSILKLLKELETAGLESLPHFAERKGLNWNELVEDLFSHVNLKRLGNNPCEVRKEYFRSLKSMER